MLIEFELVFNMFSTDVILLYSWSSSFISFWTNLVVGAYTFTMFRSFFGSFVCGIPLAPLKLVYLLLSWFSVFMSSSMFSWMTHILSFTFQHFYILWESSGPIIKPFPYCFWLVLKVISLLLGFPSPIFVSMPSFILHSCNAHIWTPYLVRSLLSCSCLVLSRIDLTLKVPISAEPPFFLSELGYFLFRRLDVHSLRLRLKFHWFWYYNNCNKEIQY